MTSGNVSDEPIAHEDDDALERLGRDRRPRALPRPPDPHPHRRLGAARGPRPAAAADAPLARVRARTRCALPVPAARHVLACGAELKSTFCVAKGGRAWVGHHIGDLKHYEVLQAYEAGIEHFERLFAVVPEVVAHDEHPDYLSTALRARARRASRPSPSSTTTPTSRRAWPSTARPVRPSARSTTAPGCGQRRHGVGRRAAGRRPSRLRARRPPLARAAAGRRHGRAPAMADGGARGCSRRAGTARSRGPTAQRAEQVAELVRSGALFAA